jgi:phosphinothricin acetyltransferase
VASAASGAVIRDAVAEDAAAICDIYNHYILNTNVSFEEEAVSVAEMERRIGAVRADDYPWLALEADGEVAGYAYAHRWHERSAYRFCGEDSVYLKAGREGRGLGGRLLAALLAAVRERTALHTLVAVIALPNEASVRLHESAGFRPAGLIREAGFKAGRWLDVGFWELRL